MLRMGCFEAVYEDVGWVMGRERKGLDRTARQGKEKTKARFKHFTTLHIASSAHHSCHAIGYPKTPFQCLPPTRPDPQTDN
jgi:hypothetical protein